MNQTWENDQKNIIVGLILARFGPNLVPTFSLEVLPLLCIVASNHCTAFQGKLMNQNWENDQKLVSGLIFAHLAPIQATILLKHIWLCQLLDIMVSYHHVEYQKKLMISSWENLVTDRRMDRGSVRDRWTHRQTDQSDFIGCCLTNIKRPKSRK